MKLFAHVRLIFSSLILVGLAFGLQACGGGGGGGGAGGGGNNSSPTSNTHFFIGDTVPTGPELWKSDGTNAGTSLVKEINAETGSNPYAFVEVGNRVFFAASTRNTGSDLWVKDDAGTRLVKVINNTASYTGIYKITNIIKHGNGVVFMTSDGFRIGSLWKSDGTTAGTVKITGYGGQYANGLTSTGNNIYFSNNTDIWKSDGNTATRISSGSIYSATGFVAVGSTVYFSAGTNSPASTGFEVFKTDGTSAGTVLLKDLYPGTNSSFPILYNLNNKLVIVAYTGPSAVGYTMWTSDGTAANTVPLMNGGFPNNSARMALWNGDLYFSNANDNGYLWKTNGTTAGTTQVNTRYSTVRGSILSGVLFTGNNLTITDGTVAGTIDLGISGYFTGCKASSENIICVVNYKLVYTDGTISNTVDITSYYDNGLGLVTRDTYRSTYPATGGFYYTDKDATGGLEPWFSDGTVAGDTMIADINTQSIWGSNIKNIVSMGGVKYFIADDGINGDGLWRTDGTNQGTYLVKDINPNGNDAIKNLTVLGNKLLFSAFEPNTGTEVWVSDGTSAGTTILLDISSGVVNSLTTPQLFTVANNKLYFATNGNLWVTDGTTGGTISLVGLLVDYTTTMVASGNKVYFRSDSNNDTALWVTSGTVVSTKVVTDTNPTSFDNAVIIQASNGKVFFNSLDSNSVMRLYASDGTNAGTVQISTDTSTGLKRSLNTLSSIIFNNEFYTVATNDIDGYELWKSDGTILGTIMIKDINLGNADSYPSGMTVVNGSLYFVANGGVAGYQLWKTDGTEAGTTIVSIRPTGMVNLYNHNNKLYFTTRVLRTESLWMTDGTDAGTIMLSEFDNTLPSNSYNFKTAGTKLYFTVDTINEGKELWVSDGTSSGTMLTKDINIGVADGASNL